MFSARFFKSSISKLKLPSTFVLPQIPIGLAVYQHFKQKKSFTDSSAAHVPNFQQVRMPTKYIFDDTRSESTDLSGFTVLPNAKFDGKHEPDFKLDWHHFLVSQHKIMGLAPDKTVGVFRGEARPIDHIMSHGILPKSPYSKSTLILHRCSSEHSNFVSFTSKWHIAAKFGALSAQFPSYGKTQTIGNGQFYLLYAELPGNQYDLAGPSVGPSFFASEYEVTAASGVAPYYVKGYRPCQFRKFGFGPDELRYTQCFNIFVRNDLSESKKAEIVHLLEGHDPKDFLPTESSSPRQLARK